MLTALKASEVHHHDLVEIGERENEHQGADGIGAEFDAAAHEHAPPMAAQHFHDRRPGDLVLGLEHAELRRLVDTGSQPHSVKDQHDASEKRNAPGRGQ